MAGIGGITNPDDLRTSTLISLIGTFVPRDGNISLLQSLWTRVGVFTNHQALFSSFDWGSPTLTVSSVFVCGIAGKTQNGLWLQRPFTRMCFGLEYLPSHLYEGLADISTHIMATEMYSIEFTTEGIYRFMSVRFWRDDSLVRVELHRQHQAESYPGCYLTAISCLLSFVYSTPNLVSISGCSSMIF